MWRAAEAAADQRMQHSGLTLRPSQPRRALAAASSAAPAARSLARRALPCMPSSPPRCDTPAAAAATMAAAASQGAAFDSRAFHSSAVRGHLRCSDVQRQSARAHNSAGQGEHGSREPSGAAPHPPLPPLPDAAPPS